LQIIKLQFGAFQKKVLFLCKKLFLNKKQKIGKIIFCFIIKLY